MNVVLNLLAIFIKLVSDVEVREGRDYANSGSCLVVLKLLNLLLHIKSIPYPPIRKKIWNRQYLMFWNAISLGDILFEICRGHGYEVAHLHYVANVLLPFWIVECFVTSVVYWNVKAGCRIVNLIYQPETKLNGERLEEMLNEIKLVVR